MRLYIIAAYSVATYLIAMCIIAVHTIAMYIIAMHTIAIALCLKCMYLIAVYIALRPNPGELKACTRTAQRSHVRQKLYQLKV